MKVIAEFEFDFESDPSVQEFHAKDISTQIQDFLSNYSLLNLKDRIDIISINDEILGFITTINLVNPIPEKRKKKIKPSGLLRTGILIGIFVTFLSSIILRVQQGWIGYIVFLIIYLLIVIGGEAWCDKNLE